MHSTAGGPCGEYYRTVVRGVAWSEGSGEKKNRTLPLQYSTYEIGGKRTGSCASILLIVDQVRNSVSIEIARLCFSYIGDDADYEGGRRGGGGGGGGGGGSIGEVKE